MYACHTNMHGKISCGLGVDHHLDQMILTLDFRSSNFNDGFTKVFNFETK